MKEKVLLFKKSRSLVGILTDPPETESSSKLSHPGRDLPNDRPAIVFLNSGLLHRVGPGRLYVKMARELASNGFAVLRFDFSGIGDSKASDNNIPFNERAVSETQEAMDHLGATRGIDRFILSGICSGADIAVKAACSDQRIVGIAPINAPFHFLSDNEALKSYVESRYKARCYWNINLRRPNFLLKLITGKANYSGILKALDFSLKSLFSRMKKMPSTGESSTIDLGPEVEQFKKELSQLSERNVAQNFIYSEADQGLDYLQVILGNEPRELGKNGKLTIELIANADHIFTPLWTQEYLIKILHNWVQEVV